MKKKCTFLISCALAASSLTAWGAIPAYDAESALNSARTDLANWMKYLPDDVFAAHVSIPGSHDTATGHNVTLASSSKAQEKTLNEQLDGGIRAFDFRPDLKTINGEKVLNCNHGLASTDLTFKDAMQKLADYLAAHPSEFMAIHMFRGNTKNDGSADTRAEISRQIDEILNQGEIAEYIVDYNPYLKVKDMRGKIVIFRRDAIAYADIHKAGNLGGWPGDTDLWMAGCAATATNASDMGMYGKIRVTDVSSPKGDATKLETEKQSIINLFNYNCTEIRPNEAARANGSYKPEWTMMFTSGEGTASGQKGYLGNAEITHPLLIDLINNAEQSGPTGIVLSDWVLVDSHEYSGTTYNTRGAAVVTAIIENNFKYIGEFILDDELFTDGIPEIPEANPISGKEYYFRNVATGQFLSCGADWGTRSVIADQGLRITPLYSRLDGNYMLNTTMRQHGEYVPNFLGPDLYVDNSAFQAVNFVPAGAPDTYYLTYNGSVTDEGSETPRDAVVALAPERNVTGNTYTDGSKYLIVPLEFTEGDTRLQWELLTEEELLAELAAEATKEKGVDLSFMIHGNKVRANDGDNNSWVLTNELVKPTSSNSYKIRTECWGSNEWYDKDQVFRVFNSGYSASYADNYAWTLSQTVNGLPNGIYNVSVQALAANTPLDKDDESTFTVNGIDMRQGMHTEENGTMDCAAALAKFRDESLGFCRIKRENIIIEDGKLEIKATGNVPENLKRAFFFDNFGLSYFGRVETGLKSVGLADETIGSDTPVEVYSLSGIMLRQSTPFADALEGLESGIYIVRANNICMKVAK